MRKLGPTKETQIRGYVNSITKWERATGSGGRRDYKLFRRRLIMYVSGEPVTRKTFGASRQSFFGRFKTFGINSAEVLRVRELWQIIDRYKLPPNAAGLEHFIRVTLSLPSDNVDKFVKILDLMKSRNTMKEARFLSGFLATHFGWRPPAAPEIQKYLARRIEDRRMAKARNIVLSRFFNKKLLSPGTMAGNPETERAMRLLARRYGSYLEGLKVIGIKDPTQVFLSIAKSRAVRNRRKK